MVPRAVGVWGQGDASEALSVGIGGNLDVGHPVENDFADIRKVISEFFGLVMDDVSLIRSPMV
ncbi:hypothetical protein [Candidatus Spongiihabitans sp.]|uniref:hypothetical protein n=1 Tax=Candidatus Spongiihabitans sp. TaxID=3101308 RepID=UPI003C6F3AB8